MGYTIEEMLEAVFAKELPPKFRDTIEARYYRKNYPDQFPAIQQVTVTQEDSRQLELAFN